MARAWRSVVAAGALGIALSAAITALRGFPPPSIHDEFSYRLAGDTFAHGRLTNPPHPMWRHFETFHVLQQPTYASKYPPGQGLVLALGQRLARHQIAGVWLACGLFIAALNWMLLAWTRPRWAWWGSVAAALWICGKHAQGGYWATSYWGGALAALGGALLLGGVRRLPCGPVGIPSLAVGAGLGLLAVTRPFEGLLFSVVPAVAVVTGLVALLRRRQWTRAALAGAGMAIPLAAAATLMLLHNERVTGAALTPPYVAYERQYGSSPALIGGAAPPLRTYRVPEMERFYWSGNGRTTAARSPGQLASRIAASAVRIAGAGGIAGFYVPLFVGPLVLLLPWVLRTRTLAVPTAGVLFVVAGMVITAYPPLPHYAAPAAAAWCLVLVVAARYLAQLRRRRTRVGRGVLGIIGACIVASWLANGLEGLRLDRDDWSWRRQSIEDSLGVAGRHLVMVEYGQHHVPDFEWVFNRADIDTAPVVWARTLGPGADADLLRYFAGRTVWRIHVDDDRGPFALQPVRPP